MAKIIVAYRNQHGPYQRVDDLLKIHIIQKDWLEKVRPYLKADQAASASLAVK
jgi:DNA uptake protein ComE-like DNA-binding protein